MPEVEALDTANLNSRDDAASLDIGEPEIFPADGVPPLSAFKRSVSAGTASTTSMTSRVRFTQDPSDWRLPMSQIASADIDDEDPESEENVVKSISLHRMFRRLSKRFRRGEGRLNFASRYHKLPRRLESDYIVHSSSVLGAGISGVVVAASRRSSVVCCSGIWKARQDRFNSFAVKSLSLEDIPRDERDLLMSELEVFLCMDHPHVVRLFDVYEDDYYLHFVMERLRGGDVYDRLEDFDETAASKTMLQMLQMLKYLHGKDIVHKDIKPHNFLYEDMDSDHLKLIDFGFSKIIEQMKDNKKERICGTGPFMAPELMFSDCGTKCDMWSLGVTSYLLQSGCMPFSGENDTELASAVLSGKFSMTGAVWDNISDDGKDFTRQLLQVDPKIRLSAEQAMEHPWMKHKNSKAFRRSLSSATIAGLSRFSRTARFKRCCFAIVAQTMSGKDYAKARDTFQQIDQDKNGKVSLADLKTALADNLNIPEEEIVEIFNAMAHSDDDTIHYSDFIAATVSAREDLDEETLRAAFNRFDCDGHGYITEEDVSRVLGEEDVQNLLGSAELNFDGRMYYKQFLTYLKPTPDSPSKGRQLPAGFQWPTKGGSPDKDELISVK